MKRAPWLSQTILLPWIGGLTVLVLIVAVVANFGIGKSSMEEEVADHWKPAVAGVAPVVAQAGSGSLAGTEQAYNAVARDMNRIAVSITAAAVNAQPGGPTRNFGSGFFVDRGVVMTNYHVVEQAGALWVTVYSPAKADYSATLLVHDRDSDLALLRVDGLPQNDMARLGNSDRVNAGDIVFVAGNVLGLGNSITSGIVANRRNNLVIDGRAYPEMIQVDATVNHGSSGGPLVNVAGEVIGINTAIYSPGGAPTGIGFAIPINHARPLVEKMARTLGAGNGAIALAWGRAPLGAPAYAPAMLQQAPLVCPFCQTARHPRCPTCQQRLVFDPATTTLVCPTGHQVAVNCGCPRCGGRMNAAPSGRGPVSLAV